MRFVSPPPAALLAQRLAAGEAHVWRARTEAQRPPTLDSQCLSVEELKRAARLRWPSQRQAFVFAHSLQRHVLSSYLGVAAPKLWFEFSEQGKPSLPHGVQFNLTHSGGAALLAVSSRLAVGIDLEDSERKIELESLALACLDEADRRRVDGVPRAQRKACLLQWWTRKEALLKAQGCGLSRDPRELPVTWSHHPLASHTLADQGRHWVITDLTLGERWRAAISTEGETQNLHGFCLGW